MKDTKNKSKWLLGFIANGVEFAAHKSTIDAIEFHGGAKTYVDTSKGRKELPCSAEPFKIFLEAKGVAIPYLTEASLTPNGSSDHHDWVVSGKLHSYPGANDGVYFMAGSVLAVHLSDGTVIKMDEGMMPKLPLRLITAESTKILAAA